MMILLDFWVILKVFIRYFEFVVLVFDILEWGFIGNLLVIIVDNYEVVVILFNEFVLVVNVKWLKELEVVYYLVE